MRNRTSSILTHFDGFLRHPVTLLVLGFALTAIVGSQIQRSQQEADKQAALLVQANEAVNRITVAVSEFSVRGHLFVATAGIKPELSARERFTEASLKNYSTYESQILAAAAPFHHDRGVASLVLDVGWYLRHAQDRVVRLLDQGDLVGAGKYVDGVESCIASLMLVLSSPDFQEQTHIDEIWSHFIALRDTDRMDCPLDSEWRVGFYQDASRLGRMIDQDHRERAKPWNFLLNNRIVKYLHKIDN